MKVVFFGSFLFSVPHLISLFEHPNIDLLKIVTVGNPQPFPIETWVTKNGIQDLLVKPTNLREDSFKEIMANLNADIFAIAAYPKKIPEVVINNFPFGGINVHPSCLPAWRGPDPIRRAILAGDPEIGVTIHQVTQNYDEGDIFWQQKVPVGHEDNLGSLLEKLAALSTDNLPQLVIDIVMGKLTGSEQSGVVSYASEVGQEEQTITSNLTIEQANRRIRAFSPFKPVLWSHRGELLEIYQNQKGISELEPINIPLKDGVLICTNYKKLNAA